MLRSPLRSIFVPVLGSLALTPVQRAIAILRSLGTSAHVWLPGANGVSVASLPSNNYLLSDGSTGYSTVDGVDGLTLDGMGSLGSELVGSGAVGLVGAATVATYSTTTGVGTVTRVDASNQSFVQWSGLSNVLHKVTISCTSGVATSVRSGSQAGSIVATVLSGESPTFFITPTGGLITITSSSGTVGFTVTSFKEYTGTHLTQPTTANKPLVRRGMLNLLTYSNTPTNASWAKTGSTAAPNETTINFPVELEPILNGASVTAPAGSKWTSAFVLSGTGTISIYCARHIGGGYEETALQVALTSTPTLYAVTHTLAGVQTAMRSGITRKTGDTATSVTFGGGGLFTGVWTAAQILAEGGIPTTTTTAASNPSAGKYWWSFDGSNDSLAVASVPYQVTDDHCVTLVARRETLTSFRDVFSVGGATSTPYLTLIETDNGTTTVYAGWRSDAAVAVTLTSTWAAGEVAVWTMRQVGNTRVLRKNGVQVATNTTALGTTTVTQTGIGIAFGGATYFNGAIGWVVPLKATMSDADCLTVERLVSSQFPNGPVF